MAALQETAPPLATPVTQGRQYSMETIEVSYIHFVIQMGPDAFLQSNRRVGSRALLYQDAPIQGINAVESMHSVV
jgi:tryptophan synthase alpha subunit